jgi:hypothetical protein
MDAYWKKAVRGQFSATLDMFGNALHKCPDELWTAAMWNGPNMPAGFSDFWYVAFHALFWLDLYLTGSVEGFTPPAPFTLAELDPQGILPERVYDRQELLTYLDHCRQKYRSTIDQLTEDQAQQVCYFLWTKGGIDSAELLIDNMRHIQEHTAQLHMFLGQRAGITSRWVGQMKEDTPTA